SSLRRASHRAPSLSRHCSVVHATASPVIILARQGSVRGGVGRTACRRSANSRVCFVLAPPRPSTFVPSQSYLLCAITWVNPAMETDGASNRPSVRLGNGGLGMNLNGSDLPGAISPEIVG